MVGQVKLLKSKLIPPPSKYPLHTIGVYLYMENVPLELLEIDMAGDFISIIPRIGHGSQHAILQSTECLLHLDYWMQLHPNV